MKKTIYFLVAMMTFAWVGCSQNEVFEEATDANLINFSTLNDKVVRAANDSTSNYGVFAVRANASTVWFMNDVVVNGGNDTYSPTQYWPIGTTVAFYAYAPQASTNLAITKTTDPTAGVTYTYTVPAAADEDFTIATPQSGLSANTVTLQFNHKLSKITVDAALTTDLTDAGFALASFASAELKVAKNQGTGSILTNNALTAAGTAATYTGAKTYMFIPQTSTACTLQLKGAVITLNGEDYFTGDLKVYTIETGKITGDAFAPNTHYAITFTIGNAAENKDDDPVFGPAITFTSSVADWTDATVAVNQPDGVNP